MQTSSFQAHILIEEAASRVAKNAESSSDRDIQLMVAGLLLSKLDRLETRMIEVGDKLDCLSGAVLPLNSNGKRRNGPKELVIRFSPYAVGGALAGGVIELLRRIGG